MILIFTNEQDFSTIKIIEWLEYYNANFRIINEKSKIKIENIELSDSLQINFEIEGERISNISSIFIRRCMMSSIFEPDVNSVLTENSDNPEITEFLYQELITTQSFFLKYLENNYFVIGNFNRHTLNKLEVLNYANKVGLNIPKTYIITNNKKNNTF